MSNRYLTAFLFFMIALFSWKLDAYAAENFVNANINWKYTRFTPQISVYELADPRSVRLWTTRSVKADGDLPAVKGDKLSSVKIRKGERKKLLLVARNPEDRPVYFFAAPHVVEPPEYSLGFKFKCLCINHAFEIGAGETWFRVVELRISEDILGENLKITHTIVGINKEKMKQFQIRKPLPDF